MSSLRVGIGYDIHRLVEGRRLMLGGVEIPFERGLLGHSDGDSLSHAVCDALLGAAGLGDIGTHFSDRDPRFAGVASLKLLEQVRALLEEHGCRVVNLDATVIAERPKLAPYVAEMRVRLAAAAGVDPSLVNVKAKTNEGLDATGRGEAIAAQAVALIYAPTRPD